MQNIKHEKGSIAQSRLNGCILNENLSSKCVVKKKKGKSTHKNVNILALKFNLPNNTELDNSLFSISFILILSIAN